MSITLPKAIGSSEQVILQSPVEMGDPRKIKLYSDAGGGVTNAEWLSFANSLFSTDNIRSCPQLFCERDSRHGAPLYNAKFIEKIPADLHKWAMFLSIYGDGYNTESYSDYRTIPIWTGEYLNYVSMPGTLALITSDQYWVDLESYLLQVKEFFESPTFLRNKDRKVTNNTVRPNNTMDYATGQLGGRAYIYRQTSRSYNRDGVTGHMTAAEAMAALTEGGASVTLEYQTNNQKWVCVCPVSVKNKASLYQVFAASTNVVDILGGVNHKKTTIKRGDKEYSVLEPRREKQYGVEVELTSDLTVRQMIDYQDKEIFFLCKSDSSIRGSKSNRYECVTKPLALTDHRTNWARFFSNVVTAGHMAQFDQTTQTGNGMHVHIAKNLFTEAHLANMAWFISNPANTEFMVALSQRSVDSFMEWARVPDYRGMKNELQAYRSAVLACSQIRGAFNIGARTKTTVEVRLFKGIVSCAEIIRNLEAVDAIFEFTRVTPWRHLTLANFYNWVKATPKTQYKLLRADLFKLDMEKMVRRAELTRLVFGLTDAEKIVERINAEKTRRDRIKPSSALGEKPFVIDAFVVATVTKIIGRRAFGQTEDGFLTVINKNTGRIAHLDSRLTAAYVR